MMDFVLQGAVFFGTKLFRVTQRFSRCSAAIESYAMVMVWGRPSNRIFFPLV